MAAGCVVRWVVDGLDAIGKLREGPPDFIISDIGMSRMSAVEFFDVVQRRFPQVAVIAIGTEAAPQGMPEGLMADAYLQIDEYPHAGFLKSLPMLLGDFAHRRTRTNIDHSLVRGGRHGNGQYAVDCPDCLRSTLVPRSPRPGHDEHLITCIHCGGVIPVQIEDGDSKQGHAENPGR
jgi:ribosomal protein S27E